MQDYTPLVSTATTTVKDGILNHEKNINALRSTYSGTDFPTENLVAGMKCYRTDLGKTYTYNGKTWTDAVSTSSLTVSGEIVTPATEEEIDALFESSVGEPPDYLVATDEDINNLFISEDDKNG